MVFDWTVSRGAAAIARLAVGFVLLCRRGVADAALCCQPARTTRRAAPRLACRPVLLEDGSARRANSDVADACGWRALCVGARRLNGVQRRICIRFCAWRQRPRLPSLAAGRRWAARWNGLYPRRLAWLLRCVRSPARAQARCASFQHTAWRGVAFPQRILSLYPGVCSGLGSVVRTAPPLQAFTIDAISSVAGALLNGMSGRDGWSVEKGGQGTAGTACRAARLQPACCHYDWFGRDCLLPYLPMHLCPACSTFLPACMGDYYSAPLTHHPGAMWRTCGPGEKAQKPTSLPLCTLPGRPFLAHGACL